MKRDLKNYKLLQQPVIVRPPRELCILVRLRTSEVRIGATIQSFSQKDARFVDYNA